MRAAAIWLLGTVYVLVVLAGMALVVWAADHEDNSADPTHWGIGSLVVLAPLAIVAALNLAGPSLRKRVGQGRWTVLFGAVLAAGLGVILVVGAQALVADASGCNDDDCVTLAIPVAIACVAGAWSLPLGLSTLRRLRYPAPLQSVGLAAVMTTLVAGSVAAVQATRQEDDYADLTLAVVSLAWILPALLAAVMILVLRGPRGAEERRVRVGRTAAGCLVSVGGWLMALPFVAGVDSDALPVMLVVSAGPGVALLAVGLVSLVPGSGLHWSRGPAERRRRSS